ncbi:MAG: hypothetical protein Solivirus1_63 [Solivirus sp.]|uniref:Uncharacterized protein n=1 Tax=Solivirus sp. TaxID=2487772 RepID=A0A3G5AFB4_9VIRU|nr:MAG: hypothetical protein Solivirus1_63 [Solivirus sp.]
MNSTNCSNSVGDLNVYGIISSLYYILFGLLGLFVNNSFMNDINTYLVMTGIGYIIYFSGTENYIYSRSIIMCTATLFYKLVAEIIKRYTDERFDASEMIIGIAGNRFYRLPVAISSLLIGAYVSLTISYFNNYFIIAFLLLTQFMTIYTVISFFPKGTSLYTITRKMCLSILISALLGSIGLGTSYICIPNLYAWFQLFIGAPIANICIPYCLYTSSQLLLLIRGKNLRRRVNVRGTKFIFIAYYIGRDAIENEV